MSFEIVLIDIKSDMIKEWKKEFKGYKNITIVEDTIENLNVDALVSPANSFGFMDGGVDMVISEYFGWHIQEQLQHKIKENHYGELIVGNADIVTTEHKQIPYIISAPTMRVPLILNKDSVNIYLATRAALLLVLHGKFENDTNIKDKVKTIAFTGMSTGVGCVSPKLCAKQMRIAIDNVIYNKNKFPNICLKSMYEHQELLNIK